MVDTEERYETLENSSTDQSHSGSPNNHGWFIQALKDDSDRQLQCTTAASQETTSDARGWHRTRRLKLGRVMQNRRNVV